MWSFLFHACLDIAADLRATAGLLARSLRSAGATRTRDDVAARGLPATPRRRSE